MKVIVFMLRHGRETPARRVRKTILEGVKAEGHSRTCCEQANQSYKCLLARVRSLFSTFLLPGNCYILEVKVV